MYNIYSALIRQDSGTDPRSLTSYTSSVISYTFQNATDYSVTLQTWITGDEKYQAEPLVASFDISVIDPKLLITFDDLMLFYVTPAAVAAAGITIYLDLRKKL